MARPSLVRADTIDLQDTTSPHAADHSKQVNSANGIAPHQASEYQHVAEERHSEEQALATAWAMSATEDDTEPTLHNGEGHEDILQNGDDSGGAEDEEADADDDLMDRISSSPSIDDEDIDFEFVYALHTFVATVEGQANATKGDTMVLLDDSNSYWWLVRVVKDSSIGYLPAEHIETPTERLARLNKHRNIDLSASMLGDVPEKSRNPLKIAMRRRNAKTVQFAAPTYVEASDYEYSDDEDQPNTEILTNGAAVEESSANGQPVEVEERNAPEEANVHATRRYSGDQASISSKNSFDGTHKASFDGTIGEDPQLSPKLVDRSEAAPLKSRKGTPRNTDSFLKDDSMETRKITLTPGLLREDGNASKSSSMDSQRNPSMESLTKVISPSESSSSAASKKDRDKKKDKQKGGMLSGLFKSKKKDKKGGRDDEFDERASSELGRAFSPANNRSTSPLEPLSTPAGRDVQVQSREAPAEISTPVVAELQGSEAAHEMIGTVPEVTKAAPAIKLDTKVQDPFRDPNGEMTPGGTITDGADFVHIPVAVDGNVEELAEPAQKAANKPGDLQRTNTDGNLETFSDARENTISPTKQVEPAVPTAPSEPARGGSTSSRSSGGEIDTPKSGSLVSHDSKQTWDDGALRAWLDAEEVKDMITIVHSSAYANGQIEPVSDDHPLMRGLYQEERGAIERMQAELDALLMGFASRKGLA